MDPSVCANPKYKRLPPKRGKSIKNIPEDIARSLKKAALRLKKEMEHVEPPHAVIEIKGEVGQCIVVKEVYEQGKIYLVIYRNADSETPLYKVEKLVFRQVQFSSLTDCRVFVLAKMVRVFFMRCKGCQFSIRTPLVGPLEFYKCRSSKVNIRIPETLAQGPEPPIPLVMVEDCQQFHVYQSNRELAYVITLCDTITGNIVDPKTNERKARYPLGKIFWGEQERSLVILSRDRGFASVPDRFALNQIEQYIMVRPLEDSDSDSEGESSTITDLFGTTPPVAKSGFLWKKSKN